MAKVNATSEQSAKITMKHLLATKGWTLTSNATAAYHSFIFDVRGRLLLVVFTRVLHAPASRNPNSEVWMKLIDDSEPWLRSQWTTHQGGTAFGTASVGNITYLEQPNGIRITLPGLTHPELVKPLYDSLVATAGPRHTIVAFCEVSASLNADIEDALMGTCDNLESQPAVCKLIREARGSASFRAAEIHQFSSIITTDGALTSVPVEALTTIFTEKEGYVAHTLQFVVVTQDDVDRCVELLAQALPYLRHLKVSNGAVNVNINLTPMIEAALSSPFIESVSSFDKPFPAESADVSIALNGVRNPTADGTVRFRLISTNDLFLQRQVQYHPLRFDQDDGTRRSAPTSQVVIEFGGVRLPVEVHRASYATVLAELKRDSDDTGSADLVHKIPMVHEAEATVERRFDAKDLQLCVQWLNEYASDAQHEKCVKCREEPFYFISRASVAFYQTRIVVEGNCRATLQRLLSVLAAAHFLGVLSLEAQLQSILLTPHLTPYYPLM